MSIYEILPALGLQSVNGKICIVMQLVVRFEISRIPFFRLIGDWYLYTSTFMLIIVTAGSGGSMS